MRSWPGSEHRQHLMLITIESVSSSLQNRVAPKYGLLTLQEEQEQLEQFPEQQLQEQGDILAKVGMEPVKDALM